MIVTINMNDDSYDIVIERGILENISDLIDLKRKVLIVTDSGVPEDYAKKVASSADEGYIFTIEQGEKNKNFENYYAITSYLIKKSFTRTDCVIAVGGGVVGDLAGFVASTYKRGIAFYNIPTTLLAMVDSSIGGKTAINFQEVKNVIGSFYQPQKVVIDVDVLKTLDERLIHAGLVEALKMGITSNATLFDCIKKSTDLQQDLEHIIKEALLIKKTIVELDPKEKGIRKILNFGHTIGHAIESASRGKLYHGECVGLGMLYMCSDIVKKEILEVLEKYHLPTFHSLSQDVIMKYIGYDKKIAGENMTIIYVNEIGTCEMRQIEVKDIIQYF